MQHWILDFFYLWKFYAKRSCETFWNVWSENIHLRHVCEKMSMLCKKGNEAHGMRHRAMRLGSFVRYQYCCVLCRTSDYEIGVFVDASNTHQSYRWAKSNKMNATTMTTNEEREFRIGMHLAAIDGCCCFHGLCIGGYRVWIWHESKESEM